jgi:3-oxoadipate enol-lactonase/4-carboxymuconolactone decarboxylase
MPFVFKDGIRLYWRRDGSDQKPAILLLNSIGTTMELWNSVVPLLLAEFCVIRMDARGHGASDAPEGDYTVEMLAADAIAVLDAAAIAHTAVCGISLGGMVAMELALRIPERISALIVACTSAAMDSSSWKARGETVRAGGTAAIAEMAIERFFSERFLEANPGLVESVRADLLAQSAFGYAGCCAAIRDMRLAQELPNIVVPTLVIGGRADISTPFESHGAAIAAAIPCSSSLLLSTAHLPALEDPQGMATAIKRFGMGRANADLQGAATALYEAGLTRRRLVLGDAWVDRSLAGRTPFNSEFQEMITRIAWNEIWNRPGLDDRTRRLLVLATTAALGRWEEFSLHVRTGLVRRGFTEEELKETLMQTAIYAGVPAANTAFMEAGKILREIAADRAAVPAG